MQHRVLVWGKPYEVAVHRKPGTKSVWVASGDYMGATIRTEDRSQGSALRRWREAATYRGNDGYPKDAKPENL